MTAIRHDDDQAQLLRLRRLREERALRQMLQARARRDAAHEQALRRRAELRAFDADLAELLHMLATALAPDIVRSAPYASARRDDLAYRRERCEYELIDDEEALAAAQSALDEAARQWHAALARSDAASTLLQHARRAAVRAAEQRLEREDPAPARTAPQRGQISGARP
jgi:hypothetical protein